MMRSTIKRVASTVVLAAGLAFSGASSALVITFQATDLADVNPGEDLWRYTYTLSGSFPAAAFGFNTLFSPALYADLQNPLPALGDSTDWITAILDQPDDTLPKDGIYNATKLVASPSLAEVFSVDFVWLGGRETPGRQPFEVFDETFAIIETGCTLEPCEQQVPLPGTLALLLAGALGIGIRRALVAIRRS